MSKQPDGTLFLDEIGDLKPESQVKLLRLLEDHTYYPVGSDVTSVSECRIVAATNADIDMLIKNGTFRKDLYYRLRSHLIRIPSLRKRKGDIPVLARHFFDRAALDLCKARPTVPPQLFTLLNTYAFPGNVRELRTMIYDAVSQHCIGILSMDSFKHYIDEAEETAGITQTRADFPAENDTGICFGDTLPTMREAENALVKEALLRSENNQSIAARVLGITPSALNKRLNKPT